MGDLKESKQALGAEVIAGLTGLRAADAAGAGLAAQLLDPAVQPDRDQRAGAAVPALPARARDAVEIVPIAFLPENHALAIAIMSYNGKVDFGLLGDYDAMPDLEEFGDMLEDALAELLKEARKRTKAAAKANAKSNGVKKKSPQGARRAPSTRSPRASP